MNNKNLVKGTMVYSLSTIVTKLGSLIFLPIITRLLTKEEFGIVGTLGPIATLFAVILGLGLYNAQMKKYIELKDNEEELGSYMFSTAMVIIVFNVLTYIFLLTPLAKTLFSYVIDLTTVKYNPLVIITVVIASVNALNTLAKNVYESCDRKYDQFIYNLYFDNYFYKKFKNGCFWESVCEFDCDTCVVTLLF